VKVACETCQSNFLVSTPKNIPITCRSINSKGQLKKKKKKKKRKKDCSKVKVDMISFEWLKKNSIKAREIKFN
jgi:hypothetical protein